MKNAEKYLQEIIIKKTSKNNLIKPDVDMLKKVWSRGRNKRNNTLGILDNIKSSFF